MKISAAVFGWHLKATDGPKLGAINPPVLKATASGECTHFYVSKRRVHGQSCHSKATEVRMSTPW